jgi:hypothetical protein
MPAKRRGPPSGTDDELRAELEALERERAAFAAEHVHLRENARDGVALSVAHARQRFEAAASEVQTGFNPVDPIDLSLLGQLAGLWAAGHPDFEQALVASLELPAAHGRPAFSKLSRDDVERELARLADEIRAREDELTRRDVERRRQELEDELATLGDVERVGEPSAAV